MSKGKWWLISLCLHKCGSLLSPRQHYSRTCLIPSRSSWSCRDEGQEFRSCSLPSWNTPLYEQWPSQHYIQDEMKFLTSTLCPCNQLTRCTKGSWEKRNQCNWTMYSMMSWTIYDQLWFHPIIAGTNFVTEGQNHVLATFHAIICNEVCFLRSVDEISSSVLLK